MITWTRRPSRIQLFARDSKVVLSVWRRAEDNVDEFLEVRKARAASPIADGAPECLVLGGGRGTGGNQGDFLNIPRPNETGFHGDGFRQLAGIAFFVLIIVAHNSFFVVG